MVATMEEPNTTGTSLARNAERLGAELCLVAVTIKSPSGMITLQDFTVLAKDDAGVQTPVAKTTKPKVHYDNNPWWEALADNERRIRWLIDRYSIKGISDGNYLISLAATAEFEREMEELAQERDLAYTDLRENWGSVLSQMKAEHPDHYERFVASGKLVCPERSAFAVVGPNYMRLAAVGADDVDLSVLSPAQRRAMAEKLNQRAEQLMTERLGAVFDGIFGQILEICKDIEDGGFETGVDGKAPKRRSGALENILTALERARHFTGFGNERVLGAINEAAERLRGVQVHDINADRNGMQNTLRSLFAPIKAAITDLKQDFTVEYRRDRDADV